MASKLRSTQNKTNVKLFLGERLLFARSNKTVKKFTQKDFMYSFL